MTDIMRAPEVTGGGENWVNCGVSVAQVIDIAYKGQVYGVSLPPAKYKVEVWGAEGGYRSVAANAGKGGYSVGELTLTENTILYVYAGGSGNTGKTEGGFNGGGSRDTYNGGGGASDIRIAQDSLYARVIVAGGGGSDGAASKKGMYGGGLTGGTATENYGTGGGGGTQTAGGTGSASASGTGTSGTYGDFGIGGKGYRASSGYGGAGGGGWYGGAGAYPDGSGDDDRGGGGGSGYIYTSSSAADYPSGCLLQESHYLENATMKAGNEAFLSPRGVLETGHSGDGYCRITVLEVLKNNDFSTLVKIDDNWKHVVAGFVKINDTWKNARSIFTKVNDAWTKSTKVFPNGKIWTKVETIPETLTSMSYNKELNLYRAIGASGKHYYTLDGITWTQDNLPSSGFSIGYGNGTYIASGADSVYYSTDGKNWNINNNATTARGIGDINYGNGVWVARKSSTGLLYSTNGINWTTSNVTDDQLYGIYYANHLWLAFSGSSLGKPLYYSIDGKTWTVTNFTNYAKIYDIKYANHKWIACGYDGVYYSLDGKTWQRGTGLDYIHCYNIDYDEDHGIWCTATYNHGIATSTDGETWTHEANGTGTVYFSEVCYRNKMWVGKTSVYAGGLYYSKDGLNWKQSNLTSEIFSQVFYGNKKWFACSYYSTFDPSSYSGVYTSIGAE